MSVVLIVHPDDNTGIDAPGFLDAQTNKYRYDLDVQQWRAIEQYLNDASRPYAVSVNGLPFRFVNGMTRSK